MRAPIRELAAALGRLFASGSRRDPLGSAGERAAARLLRRKRFRILARNVRLRFGEADLLCLAPDRRTIVVVEVKTRHTRPHPGAHAPPPPEASITPDKRRKLIAVLNHLARANRWTDRPLRIDVVAVEWPDSGDPTLRHHEGAVTLRP